MISSQGEAGFGVEIRMTYSRLVGMVVEIKFRHIIRNDPAVRAAKELACR